MGSDVRHAHLLSPHDGVCWWCRTRPADSREHKYKRTDLARMWTDDGLIWGDGDGTVKDVQGIGRSHTVRFGKTMCAHCNNARSQAFDQAYDTFSEYLSSMTRTPFPWRGIDFQKVFGIRWPQPQMNVARYYCKHFGCRMVALGLPVPESLRSFLDGASNMPDASLAIVANRALYTDRRLRDGLSLSPDLAFTDFAATRIKGVVMAAYVGHIGVRYEWREPSEWPEPADSFFGHRQPVINRMIDDEEPDTSWWASLSRRRCHLHQ